MSFAVIANYLENLKNSHLNHLGIGLSCSLSNCMKTLFLKSTLTFFLLQPDYY